MTSSSCSGRIAVFCGVAAVAKDAANDPKHAEDPQSTNLITKGGKWLLSEHATITLQQLKAALASDDVARVGNSNMVRYGSIFPLASRCSRICECVCVIISQIIFKHEPFIMHVACRDLTAAKELLQWGLACGFRESGVVLGTLTTMFQRPKCRSFV